MQSSSATSLRRLLPWALLGSVAVVQIYLVFSGYGIQWLKAAWRTRDLEAETRSARFLLGQRAANYLQFLEEQVPESINIALPYRVGEFSQQSLMQFFLMPRGIPGCGCEGNTPVDMSRECVQCLRREDLAVPAIGAFPPEEVLAGSKKLVQHDEDTGWFHGVYLTDGFIPTSSQVHGITEISRPLAILLDISLYVGIFTLGALAIGGIFPSPAWRDLLSLSIPIGLGLWTIALFLTGWAGAEISRATVLIVFMVFVVVLGWLRYRNAGSLSPFPPIRIRRSNLDFSGNRLTWILPSLGVLGLTAAAIVISIGRAYSTVDGIANWAIKGYAIAQEGSIFAGAGWGNHGLAYPQNLHLSVAIFSVIDGDVLPGSKLMFPLLALSLVVGCYGFWRRAGVSQAESSIASLVLASIPLLFFHSTIGFANIPFTTYVVLGVLYLASGTLRDERSSMLLGSLLLGFGAWTRPEGVGFTLLVLLSLLLGTWLLRRRASFIATAVVPQITISAIWLVFGSRYVANDEVGRLLAQFISTVRDGSLKLEPLVVVLNYAALEVAKINSWGMAIIAVPVLFVFGLVRPIQERSQMAVLVGFVGLIALAIPVGMFYIAGYTSGYGTSFLQQSFDRAVLPAFVLLLWAVICFALAKSSAGTAGLEEN